MSQTSFDYEEAKIILVKSLANLQKVILLVIRNVITHHCCDSLLVIITIHFVAWLIFGGVVFSFYWICWGDTLVNTIIQVSGTPFLSTSPAHGTVCPSPQVKPPSIPIHPPTLLHLPPPRHPWWTAGQGWTWGCKRGATLLVPSVCNERGKAFFSDQPWSAFTAFLPAFSSFLLLVPGGLHRDFLPFFF